MKKITKFEETTDVTFRSYQITFDDESTFEFEVLLDNGEWVLETSSDERRGVRLCQAELEQILKLIQKLNGNLK